ncbi:hypothetical protein K449DRAFT_439914 [Hypoxylon sp. EC38]|nr:hypothetical protein K449DRAFT_439914 [Hypoxylon sp. EC38]
MSSGGAATGTRSDQVVLRTQSILAYTTAVAKGDAPITTLLQQQIIGVELAARRAKVQREVDDAINKYKQELAKYGSFPFLVPYDWCAYTGSAGFVVGISRHLIES